MLPPFSAPVPLDSTRVPLPVLVRLPAVLVEPFAIFPEMVEVVPLAVSTVSVRLVAEFDRLTAPDCVALAMLSV